VTFVVYYCVWAPARAKLVRSHDSATAMLVANPAAQVRNGDVTGVFTAPTPLSSGAFVRGGQLLGHIESPKLDAQIEQAALDLRLLQTRRLQLEQQSAGSEPQWQVEQEARDIAARVGSATHTLAQLHALRRQLAVYAPADGYIQGGLSGSMSVTPHQSIVSLYPHGADVLVEVTAPMDVLNDLRRRDRVMVEFPTTSGKAQVAARPIPSSVRPFTWAGAGKPDEMWGVLQCKPSSAVQKSCLPGLIGKLH
jgi:hypothetical protein